MRHARPAALAVLVLAAAIAVAQQQDFSKVEIKTVPVSGHVSMLVGAGGNIGVSMGPDGAFIIDDQYAPLSDKIKAAIAGLGPQPLRFVVNTHWHGDHTGGNEAMGQAGALIVAHDNVRRRMSTEQFNSFFNRKTPPAAAKALPVVTFGETVTFHINGDELHAFHVPNAHTDGDAIIHFKKADAIHMGDTFFNGNYPYIDVDSGGSVAGMIGAADRVLALAGPNTKIIPGHGPLATKADLQAYREVLGALRDRVGALVRAGKTLDEIKAAAPMKDYDAKWGGGFMKPDQLLTLAHADLSKKK
jgi:glyoxylase-like metal-dependent hydrolase (beta-lactamase superfamily II)